MRRTPDDATGASTIKQGGVLRRWWQRLRREPEDTPDDTSDDSPNALRVVSGDVLEGVSTMDVQVRFMGDLPSVVGRRDAVVTLSEGKTVGDLLASLSESFGAAFTDRIFSGPGKLQHTIVVFVDGEDIKERGGFAAPLGKGAVEVVMLPMFGGG